MDDSPLLPTHALCPKCQQTKPIDQFKRYLTPAEAKYRGYSGERRVQIETRNCADCRPRRRTKPESFTTAELKKKAKRGEISPVLVQLMEKTRTRKALTAQTAAANKRWDAVRIRQWTVLVEAVNAELIDLRQQRAYAKRRGDRPEVLAYVEGYAEVLMRLRADLKIALRRGNDSPQHKRWQDYLNPAERQTISDFWHAVPFAMRQAGMRPPQAFARADLVGTTMQQDMYIPAQTPTPNEPKPEKAQPETDWDDF
jgi:hypothetical protein